MPAERGSTPALEVLIVDDEPDIRELLSEHLRVRGHRVAVVSDGRTALAELDRAASRYTIILTDLHLPGADGLAILERARLLNPSAYVVIITGYASLDSAIQAVRLGAYDYLTKPFSLGQIDVLLSRVQDRILLESENRQLTRQIADRDVDVSHAPAHDRFAQIEGRLAGIEQAIRDLAATIARRQP